MKPLRDAIEAIEAADLITLGPGSLFTSVVPNLLVDGVPRAIRRSRAIKACFVNLMSQPGETTDFSASDHVTAICEHAGDGLVDCAVVNTARISSSLQRRYAKMNAAPIRNDLDEIRRLGVEVVKASLVLKGPRVRHDPDEAARVAIDLALRGRVRRDARGRTGKLIRAR